MGNHQHPHPVNNNNMNFTFSDHVSETGKLTLRVVCAFEIYCAFPSVAVLGKSKWKQWEENEHNNEIDYLGLDVIL